MVSRREQRWGNDWAQRPRIEPADGTDHATPKAILNWEEVMPTLVGFGRFAALPEEQISENISRRTAILFQPARASAVTVSMFSATTLQFTIGFASLPAIASAI